MSRRLEIELTSRRADGDWTWRAAGARRPKGQVSAALVPETADVGTVLKAEADGGLDGLEITALFAPRTRAESEDRLELIGSRTEALVTTRLVSKGARRREDAGPDSGAERKRERSPRRARDKESTKRPERSRTDETRRRDRARADSSAPRETRKRRDHKDSPKKRSDDAKVGAGARPTAIARRIRHGRVRRLSRPSGSIARRRWPRWRTISRLWRARFSRAAYPQCANRWIA